MRTEPETPRGFGQIARGVAFSRPRPTAMAVGIFGGAGGEKKAGGSQGCSDIRVVVGEVSAGGMVPAQLVTLLRSRNIVMGLEKVVPFWQAGPGRQNAFVCQRIGEEN